MSSAAGSSSQNAASNEIQPPKAFRNKPKIGTLEDGIELFLVVSPPVEVPGQERKFYQWSIAAYHWRAQIWQGFEIPQDIAPERAVKTFECDPRQRLPSCRTIWPFANVPESLWDRLMEHMNVTVQGSEPRPAEIDIKNLKGKSEGFVLALGKNLAEKGLCRGADFDEAVEKLKQFRGLQKHDVSAPSGN